MKIVRIIARLNVGGPARHVVWLSKELQNAEFESVLLAGSIPEGEEDMGYFALENGVEPFYIKEMSRELSLKDVVSLWKVFRKIQAEKPDIIHTHTAKAGTIGRVAGFLYRWLTPKTLIGKPRPVKFVHTYHGHVFHSYYGNLKTKIFLFIEKNLARFATHKIIVISRQQFEEIHKQFGVGREKQFKIIPLGIDFEPFQNVKEKRSILRKQIGARENEIIVGFVGRLTEIKNIPLLLEVAKLFETKENSSFSQPRFVIIGDGNQRKLLEDKAGRLNLGERVEFLGNRNDADIFYAGLDIVALTSLNEGTPLSLIEAMANGKTVISTAVGGVVDLLGEIWEKRDGFNVCKRGISVASGDAEGFYKGLNYLAENDKVRKSLEENGLKFVSENYSKERLVKDITALYRNLI